MAYDHLEIDTRWGTILGEDNERMSNSRGNVVNPDDIGLEYGAEALRLYEMFMGPLEAVKPWQTSLGLRRPKQRGRTRPSDGHRDGGGRGRATPHGAAPAFLIVSTHLAMVTTARCTEVAG
jgi:hypothetical protein